MLAAKYGAKKVLSAVLARAMVGFGGFPKQLVSWFQIQVEVIYSNLFDKFEIPEEFPMDFIAQGRSDTAHFDDLC